MHSMTYRSRGHQSGAATLIVTMVLLFSTSIVMLYLNRNILFEQRTAANQVRATTAIEVAEAGIEWATGMLSTAWDIDANCDFLTTTNISFRRKYIQTQWNATPATSDVVPALTTYPGCKINGTTRTCNCPNVPGSGAATASLGPAVLPGFTVTFAATDDPEAVRVISTGCTAQAGTCTPGTRGDSEATASVSAILKLRPLLRAAPASPLTCGVNCNIGGSYNISNTDVNTNGILINAGGTISPNGGTTTTTPGQPTANAMVGSDSSLTALATADPTCSNSTMFKAYFGSTLAQYAASPMVKTIPNCTTAGSCGTAVDAAYNDGWRSFYFPQGFARNNSSGSLGSASDPVTIVSGGDVEINGNIDVYGVVFANNATVNGTGSGNMTLHGALVTCGNFNANGNGTLDYDPAVLESIRRATGAFVRVPGSWTDRCTASTANPPVITCS